MTYVLSVFIFMLGIWAVSTDFNTPCPEKDCKHFKFGNQFINDTMKRREYVTNKDCFCERTLPVCLPHKDQCKKNRTCDYRIRCQDKNKCNLKMAFCKKFDKCPDMDDCRLECVSGFRTDQNNCPVCYCENPCKELECPVTCTVTNIKGELPIIKCPCPVDCPRTCHPYTDNEDKKVKYRCPRGDA